MGGTRVKIKNLRVVKLFPEQNLIVIKGAVPGHKGSLVLSLIWQLSARVRTRLKKRVKLPDLLERLKNRKVLVQHVLVQLSQVYFEVEDVCLVQDLERTALS